MVSKRIFPIVAFFILAARPATSAGPSTPEDWQRMYDACAKGVQSAATDRGLSPEFPVKFCGCLRDTLSITPEPERDAQAPVISDRCVQFATGRPDYPEAGITNLRKTCMQRADIPKASMFVYCDCYVDLMQKTVPWRDFLLLDSAISTKGIGALDADEKSILGKALETAFYCSQKTTR